MPSQQSKIIYSTLKHITAAVLVEQDELPDFESWSLWVGFAILFTLSFTFEVIENLRCTIDRYRESSGTSGEYDGDSYQNIIADLIVVQFGYMVSWLFLFLDVPWMSAVWFVMVDIWLILYMRDSVLLFFNVFVKNKRIIVWQEDGVKIAKERQKNKLSLVCPPSAFFYGRSLE